jgi:ribonucleoside-diphosphate reductase beta chain
MAAATDTRAVGAAAAIAANTLRDVASAARQEHLNDPQTLYRHWEEGQWSPFAVDLSADRGQWGEMTGDDRSLVLWALASLMVAEERITTKFSGLVGAYDTEEEATFLATQQVDEARHMQFYARFQDEVIADPQAIGSHVERARAHLSPAFTEIFDGALVRAHERMVANPGDAGAKVDFVTTYHVVIEGTLGLTAFNFITGYLERESLLPGFVEGYSKIHHDEQRHIAYGIWYLREAVRAEPSVGDHVRETLRSLLPAVAQALTPPDREGTDWEALGASSEEIREFALSGLSRRLKVVGVPLDSL